MKYTYAYKTSDGTRHEAAMDAPSREVVFETLRAKGIKAIKVVAADGSKANGEVRGVRKRVVALVVVCLLFSAVLAAIFAFRAGESASPAQGAMQKAHNTTSSRHYVYGDPEIIHEIEDGKLGVFATPVERYLFAFAIPGKSVTTLRAAPDLDASNDLAAVTILPSDSREVVEYKQILNGMKEELKDYLEGGGTWTDYMRELAVRQNEERHIYERTCQEIKNCTNAAFRVERNAALRAMGLPAVPQAQ